MKFLTAILALCLSGCAWTKDFFRTHEVTGTLFVERGENRAGVTVTTKPSGKRVIPSK